MMAPGTFVRGGTELMGYRLLERSRASGSRVLAVAGEREQQLILRSLPEVATAYPRGQHRVVPAVGHAWNAEAPDVFARMVRSHVNGHGLPEQLVVPAGRPPRVH